MKNLLVLISLVLCGLTSNAQHGLLNSSHTYYIQNNQLTVYQSVSFSFGSGSACPPLIWHQFNFKGGIVTVDVLYDYIGIFPSFGGGRTDTLVNTFNGTFDTLVVNVHAKVPDSIITNFDTLFVRSDTTFNIVSALEQHQELENSIKIYPTPATDFVNIETSADQRILGCRLFNVAGQVINSYGTDLRVLPVKGLPPGLYFLNIRTDKGVSVEKVLIE